MGEIITPSEVTPCKTIEEAKQTFKEGRLAFKRPTGWVRWSDYKSHSPSFGCEPGYYGRIQLTPKQIAEEAVAKANQAMIARDAAGAAKTPKAAQHALTTPRQLHWTDVDQKFDHRLGLWNQG